VTGAWFSPDDQTILTVDSNYLLRLWSVPNGARIGPVYQSTSPVTGTLFAPNSQTVLINSLRGVVQLREQPRPVAGAPDRIVLWAQTITGLELDDSHAIHALDPKTWSERQRLLVRQGGSPVP